MKKVTSLLFVVLILCSFTPDIPQAPDIGCWVKNARGKWYWFSNVFCNQMAIHPPAECYDCCPDVGTGTEHPGAPANLTSVQYDVVSNSNGTYTLIENSSRAVITTLTAEGFTTFQNTGGLVYEIIETSFKMKKKPDGTTVMIAEDGTEFILNDKGIEHLKKQGGEVKAIELKTRTKPKGQ